MKTQHERNMDKVYGFDLWGLPDDDDENRTEYRHHPGIGFPPYVPCIINDDGNYEYRRCYKGTQRDY